MMKSVLFSLSLGVILGACAAPPTDNGDPGIPGGDSLTPGGDSFVEAPADLEVMTWNLYLGTDFESLFDVTSLAEIPGAAAAAWEDVQATRFEDRAESIADSIAATAPALVGLQEVELYRIQSPGDGWTGAPAEDVALDFLDLLLTALADRGLDYAVVARTTTVDIEVPMTVPTGADDIRITDQEVILALPEVEIANVREMGFAATATVTIPGLFFPIQLPRGWASVDATWRGEQLTFVSTHLEVVDDDVQTAQGDELVEALTDASLPVVLVGDLNSTPDGTTTPTQAHVIAAGYVDAWDQAAAEGPTCCQSSDLSNAESTLSRRIDYIFVSDEIEVTDVSRLGHDPTSRTPSGLWPSDHAGVRATIRGAAQD